MSYQQLNFLTIPKKPKKLGVQYFCVWRSWSLAHPVVTDLYVPRYAVRKRICKACFVILRAYLGWTLKSVAKNCQIIYFYYNFLRKCHVCEGLKQRLYSRHFPVAAKWNCLRFNSEMHSIFSDSIFFNEWLYIQSNSVITITVITNSRF